MQADKLHLLKELKMSPFMPAVQALLEEVREGFIIDLVKANQSTFERCQGGIMAIDYLTKIIADVDLLRSLQGNPNVDPVVDKE